MNRDRYYNDRNYGHRRDNNYRRNEKSNDRRYSDNPNSRRDDRSYDKRYPEKRRAGFTFENREDKRARMAEEIIYDRRKEYEEERRRRREEEEEDFLIANHRRLGAIDDSDDDFVPMNSSTNKDGSSDSEDDDEEGLIKEKKHQIVSDVVINVYEPLVTTLKYGRAPFVIYTIVDKNDKKFESKFVDETVKPRVPKKLTRKKLGTEPVESMIKPSCFKDDLIDELYFNIDNVPYDPFYPDAPSHIPHISDEEYNFNNEKLNYMQIGFIMRSTFVNSKPQKRQLYLKNYEKFFSLSKIEKVHNWIKIISLEDEIEEYKKRDELYYGTVDVGAKKLSMLDGAFKECAGAPNIYELDLYKIDLLTDKYGCQSEEVKLEWDNITNKYPNILIIWKKFILYYRSKMRLFDCKKYEKIIIKCLDKLNGIISGTFTSHHKREGTEEFVIDLIVSLATLHIESGRMHYAIAILQAYIEFYLTLSDDYMDFNKKLENFKTYWESPIVKAGHPKAQGWRYQMNSDVVKRSEEDEYNELVNTMKDVYINLKKIAKNHIVEKRHNAQMWKEAEVLLMENFWKPTVNNHAEKFPMYDPYVPFNVIKPYLINFPQKIRKEHALKVIFSLLSRLGAVIPGFDNYSQDELCKEWSESFSLLLPIPYKGLDEFIENCLIMIGQTSMGPHFVRCIAAIIITKRKWMEKELIRKGEDVDVNRAIQELMLVAGKYTSYFKQESLKNFTNAYISYTVEQIIELKNFFETQFEQSCQNEKISDFFNRINLFRDSGDPHTLLSTLRLAVVTCDLFPHAVSSLPNENTKLAFLHKIAIGNMSAVGYSEVYPEELNTSLELWKSKIEEICCIKIGSGAEWIGDIKDMYLQLYATFLYECEDSPMKKFEFVNVILEGWNILSKKHSEIYHSFWFEHSIRFNLCIHDFMKSLQTAMEKYPRSPKLLKMYIHFYPKNLMNCYFDTFSTIEDEVGMIMRCICMIATEKQRLQSINTEEFVGNKKYLHRLLQKTAELCSETISPETYFWRSLVVDTVLTSDANDETLEIAIDQCPFSKLLFFNIIEHKAVLKISQKLPELAKEKKQLIIFTENLLKQVINNV